MNITHEVNIDLAFAPSGVALPIKVMQGDVYSRWIAFTLTSNGTAWTAPEGVGVCIGYQKPDGSKGIYDTMPDGTAAWSVDGNVVAVAIAPQVMADPGEVELAVSLLSGEAVLSTFPVWVQVQSLPGYDGIEEEWIATTKGAKGDTGKSAYEYAKDGGYTGTEAEFAAELKALPDAMERMDGYLDTAAQTLSQILEIVDDGVGAPPIVCQASGEVIAVSDASDRHLHNLKLYGKTTQDATPSPDAPAALVNLGASGSIRHTVVGKNLLDVEEECTFTGVKTMDTYIPAGTYVLSLGGESHGGENYPGIRFNNNNIIMYLNKTSWTITLAQPETKIYLYANDVNWGASSGITTTLNQLMLSAEGGEYEPYKGQTLTMLTPNGLPGIPVSSGGNWTDADGQQYLANYRDWARGVDVQMVNTVDLSTLAWALTSSGSAYWWNAVIADAKYASINTELVNGIAEKYTMRVASGMSSSAKGQMAMDIQDMKVNTGSASEKPSGLMLYQLATPIETAIPAESLTAYATVYTSNPNTLVFNDAGVHMEMAYVADTKSYVDNKIAAALQVATAIYDGTVEVS